MINRTIAVLGIFLGIVLRARVSKIVDQKSLKARTILKGIRSPFRRL